MDPQRLQQLIEAKREWTEPLSAVERAKGFKGWCSSKYLPHFDAPGVRQFISYRLADAMPAERRHEWQALLAIEDDLDRRRKIEAYVDRGWGQCHLRDPRIAELVQGNFWHHDGVKYRLLAWMIMPNHVHVLIEMWQTPLCEILKSWKSYTSKEAKKVLGGNGAVWEADYFDRYIRDEAHFWRVVHYIESNPVKTNLVRSPDDWLWSSARYRSRADLSARTLTHPGADRVPPPPGVNRSGPDTFTSSSQEGTSCPRS